MVAWGLTDADLLTETRTARLWQVMRGNDAAVLKVLKPKGADEARGMELMQWYQGRGAARVFDASDGILLMERLAGPSLGDLVRNGDDAGAAVILCDVIRDLHNDRPEPPQTLLPLAHHFAPLFDSAPTGDAARAARLAEVLLDSTVHHVALHGDLHHDNVLWAGRGWLAIDPQGAWGDPAYEPSNAFRNPEGCDDLMMRPDRINALARTVASRLGFPVHRVLGWAAAHAALSIIWHHEAGTPTQPDEALLPRLLAAHAAQGDARWP
jgi:streptomycin 6-kinase